MEQREEEEEKLAKERERERREEERQQREKEAREAAEYARWKRGMTTSAAGTAVDEQEAARQRLASLREVLQTRKVVELDAIAAEFNVTVAQLYFYSNYMFFFSSSIYLCNYLLCCVF